MPGKSFSGPLPQLTEPQRTLADRMRMDLNHLAVDIGERNISQFYEALTDSAEWIAAELEDAGYDTVERQRFVCNDKEVTNLSVEIRGATAPDEIVIIGAHYDSVIFCPAANDNGSGVVALLALARTFAGREPPARTLRFVAFVNEEPPYFQTPQMGSWVYAKACKARGDNIVAMLSLETIGYYSDTPGSQHYPKPFNLFYPSKGNFIAFVGNNQSKKLVRQVVKSFRAQTQFPSEGLATFDFVAGIGWSDQWSFWQEGYPGLMVTDTAPFRYPYYHLKEDTPDKIDFESMARVVEGIGKVVEELVSD